jgi:hypothetical protein
VIADDDGRPDLEDFLLDPPLVPGDEKTQQEKEPSVKLVIQSLKRSFAILRKKIRRQVEGGEEEKKADAVIRPEQKGHHNVIDGLYC